ncbi:MAG: GGDEF domain-containing protein, partial [Acidobacteriota bacterium]
MISFKRTIEAIDAMEEVAPKLTAWAEGINGLMIALEDSVSMFPGDDAASFKESFTTKRLKLNDSSSPKLIQQITTATGGELRAFAGNLASSSVKKEEEYKRIIRIVADAGAAITQSGSHQAQEIVEFASKLDIVSRLESMVEIRKEISKRVVELESLASRVKKGSDDHAQNLEWEIDRVRERLLTAETLAQTDPLTKLGNRRMVEQLFEAATKNGIGFCFVLLDLDGFKLVNDRYGHQQGDQILKAVGRLLAREARENEVACRWGGDEFVVVAKNGGLAAAQLRAFEMMSNVFGEFVINHQGKDLRVQLHASVGIAEYRTVQHSSSLHAGY